MKKRPINLCRMRASDDPYLTTRVHWRNFRTCHHATRVLIRLLRTQHFCWAMHPCSKTRSKLCSCTSRSSTHTESASLASTLWSKEHVLSTSVAERRSWCVIKPSLPCSMLRARSSREAAHRLFHSSSTNWNGSRSSINPTFRSPRATSKHL